MMVHYNSIHLERKRFECSHCGLKFAYKQACENHEKTHENRIGKTKTKKQKTAHSFTERISGNDLTNENKFKCTLCSFQYSRPHDLRNHLECVHGMIPDLMCDMENESPVSISL